VTTVSFDGGTIRTGAGDERADWVIVEGEVIAAVGAGEAPAADRRVPLDGATVVPAFRDAHVHLPATGLYATGLDLRGERTAGAIGAALARRAREPGAVVFGGNFEDPVDASLTAAAIDASVGDKPALLARADMHSCIVSTALLRRLDLDGVDGVDRDEDGRPTGYLRERAASVAWRWLDGAMTRQQQRDAVRAAVEVAYSKGVAEVHEMFVVEWRGWDAAELFAESVSDVALDVAMFLATDEVERVREVVPYRIGGDFFLDGSFGSHTAWMSEPYVSPPPPSSTPTGVSYRSDAEVVDLFGRAQRAGMQVGVHAIGDAAIEQAIAAWEQVAIAQGADAVRERGHRIEHFECARDDHIARAARLGLRASVQPAFDRFWGGKRGLYAMRIGWERARKMNRFKTMAAAGLTMAAGSDSTVTPLDPFLQMASLRAHHVIEERVSAEQALALHTRGPAEVAGHAHVKGAIASGLQADLAVVDRDPLTSGVAELLETEVLGTWIGGRRVWPRDQAERA
jgi:predicted amidohydrolase YtcJ